MPSLHGVRINGISLSLSANTFIEMLRTNGWRTALIGKSHLQNFGGLPPALNAGQRRGLRRRAEGPGRGRQGGPRLDPIYDRKETPGSSTQSGARPVPARITASSIVELCSNHATRVHGHYTKWLRDGGRTATGCAGLENALPHDYVMPQAWRTALPEELYPTSYVVERTMAGWTASRGRRDAPFFLQCSFPDPHHPFTPPGRYWDMYKPADMELPSRIPHRQPAAAGRTRAALIAARDDGSRNASAQPRLRRERARDGARRSRSPTA